jgi:hypothetical protein
MLKKLLVIIFPFVDNYIKNKKIRAEIEKYNNHINQIDNSDVISIDVVKQKYAETISTKDKLEDKAKSNIVAVTISITLILGASNLLNGIYTKFSYAGINWARLYCLF